jgi:hypothetical protein
LLKHQVAIAEQFDLIHCCAALSAAQPDLVEQPGRLARLFTFPGHILNMTLQVGF